MKGERRAPSWHRWHAVPSGGPRAGYAPRVGEEVGGGRCTMAPLNRNYNILIPFVNQDNSLSYFPNLDHKIFVRP